MPRSGSSKGPLFSDFVSHLKTQKKPLGDQEAQAVAAKKLKQGGYMDAGGGLTPKGKARQGMGAAARAKLRGKP